jgi:hypothetical protein
MTSRTASGRQSSKRDLQRLMRRTFAPFDQANLWPTVLEHLESGLAG